MAAGIFRAVRDRDLSPLEAALKARRMELIGSLGKLTAQKAMPISRNNLDLMQAGAICPTLDTFLFLADRAGMDVSLTPREGRRFAVHEPNPERTPKARKEEKLMKGGAVQRRSCAGCIHFSADDPRMACTAFNACFDGETMPGLCLRYEPK